MFLTLVPPSCLIASKRIVVNIIYVSNKMSTKAISTTLNNISKDINMNVLRGRLNMSSCNTSREASANSNVSFIPYVDRMEASKPIKITGFSPSLSLRSSKKVLAKSKFLNKEGNKSTPKTKVSNTYSYTQVSALSFSKVLRIKKSFPSLLLKKIKDIHRMIHSSDKPKLKINIMIKRLSHRQIIIPIGNNNAA